MEEEEEEEEEKEEEILILPLKFHYLNLEIKKEEK